MEHWAKVLRVKTKIIISRFTFVAFLNKNIKKKTTKVLRPRKLPLNDPYF
jgi:hypothetical protein